MSNKSSKRTTLVIVRAGIIAGLYVVLSLITLPIASGVIQFRISEALCMLALIFPESIVALFVGCAFSNLITGCLPLDTILGSLITLVAGASTFLCGKFIKNRVLKIFFGGIFPVTLNALLLPFVWLLYGVPQYIYPLQVLFLLISQSVSIYALGIPIYIAVDKLKNKGISFFN